MIRLTTQSGPDALVTRSAFYLLAGSFHLGRERPLFPGHSSQEMVAMHLHSLRGRQLSGLIFHCCSVQELHPKCSLANRWMDRHDPRSLAGGWRPWTRLVARSELLQRWTTVGVGYGMVGGVGSRQSSRPLDFPLEWSEQSTVLHFHYVYTNHHHCHPCHQFVSVFVFVFVFVFVEEHGVSTFALFLPMY